MKNKILEYILSKLKGGLVSRNKWGSTTMQLVKIAVYIGYSLLSPSSPAKQSYMKITYTGCRVLAYENGYDGDSAAVKRPYRLALYRRSHTHVYICIYISTCKNCKVYFEHFMNLRAIGRFRRKVAERQRRVVSHKDRNGAVCLAHFCPFIAALNAEAIGRVSPGLYSIIWKRSFLISGFPLLSRWNVDLIYGMRITA